MSVLLFIVGAVVTMLGIGMAGYGIPINEFSFGNTLIVAGTTATVGGLIIIGIGAAVGQLQRISDALATTRMPVRPSRPLELVEPAAAPAAGHPDHIPFPPRLEPAAAAHEAPLPLEALASAGIRTEDRAAAPVAPTLRNPDMPAVAVAEYDVEEYEDVSLSPRQPMPASAPAEAGGPAPLPPAGAKAAPMARRAPNRHSMQAGNFRSRRSVSRKQTISMPCGRRNPSRRSTQWPTGPASSRRQQWPRRTAPNPRPPSEPAVAILKSGVVDGMGYTLYVDGSIEAELPQGTLRFASINELRNYLAKNP